MDRTIKMACVCGLVATLTALQGHSQGMSGGTPGGGMGLPGVGQTPDIALSEIADNLFLVSKGRLGNSALLIAEEGALLVDSAFTVPFAEAVLVAIAEIYEGNIRYLVNTHAHGDHTGGNAAFSELGAVVIGHEAVRSILAAGSQRRGPSPTEALPVLTYGDGQRVTIHLNGESVRAIHMPAAHTMDNSVVHFVNANVFAVGDIFSPARYPVFDGTTSQGALDALDTLLSLSDSDSRFVPGWGEVTDRGEVVAYRQMLAMVRSAIANLVREGNTLDEVIASNPTASFDETWGSSEHPLFLPVIYEEIIGTQ